MRRSIRMLLCLCLIGLLVYGWPSTANAKDLVWRNVNLTQQGVFKGLQLPLTLGFTLFNYYDYPFFDGVPEGLPENLNGFQFSPIYFTGNRLADAGGHKVEGTHKTDIMAFLVQWVYLYPWQPEDPHFRVASDFFFNYATVHVDAGEPTGVGVGAGGVGDVLWTPLSLIIAYEKCSFCDWIRWNTYISPLIQFPSGEYDSGDAFNPGSNQFALDLAFIGWENLGKNFGPLAESQWQWNIVYVHPIGGNGEFSTAGLPSNVRAAIGSQFTNYTTGDLWVFNNAFLFPIMKTFKLGFQVSWMQQLSSDSLAGSSIRNSEASEVGIGPAALLKVGNVSIFADGNFDVHAANTYRQYAFYVAATYAFNGGDVVHAIQGRMRELNL